MTKKHGVRRHKAAPRNKGAFQVQSFISFVSSDDFFGGDLIDGGSDKLSGGGKDLRDFLKFLMECGDQVARAVIEQHPVPSHEGLTNGGLNRSGKMRGDGVSISPITETKSCCKTG